MPFEKLWMERTVVCVRYSTKTPVKVVMLGAGGTGSYIAMHLYRLLYCLGRKVRVIIADGDSVEEKNLIRQHFTVSDLGMNKAQVLAERYAEAFKMKAEYIPDFIEDKERLRELIKPDRVRIDYRLSLEEPNDTIGGYHKAVGYAGIIRTCELVCKTPALFYHFAHSAFDFFFKHLITSVFALALH